MVLGISKGWPIKYYIKTFEELAKETFTPWPLCHIPIILWLSNLILLYLYGVYLALYIEGAFKRAFGLEINILEYSYTSSKGVKFGFPVITFPETSPCIFTNYVGRGTRAEDYSE